jgi:hypothetical protein
LLVREPEKARQLTVTKANCFFSSSTSPNKAAPAKHLVSSSQNVAKPIADASHLMKSPVVAPLLRNEAQPPLYIITDPCAESQAKSLDIP